MKPNAWQIQNNPRNPLALTNWLDKARSVLKSIPEEPVSSLYAITTHVLGKPRSWIQAHPEFILSNNQAAKLENNLNRLLQGEPLPYITGIQEFFGLDIHVTPDVLIPRPETEMLVEAALAWLEEHPEITRVADIGTGSGCIAVSLAKNKPSIKIFASDFSRKSLQIAQKNIIAHKLEDRIALLQTNLMSGIKNRFGLICANLPYIPSAKLSKLRVSRYEPLSALDGGEDGLKTIDQLLTQINHADQHSYLILLEIESSQAASIQDMIHSHFPEASITITNDLNNLPRLVKILL